MSQPGQLDRWTAMDLLVEEVHLPPARAQSLLNRFAKVGLWLSRSPQHGTRACYTSGWEPGHEQPVSGPGCRCDLCREANAQYQREWRASR
jgi:hypothetical protein